MLILIPVELILMDQLFDKVDIHEIDYYHFSYPIDDFHVRVHIERKRRDLKNLMR